MKFCIALIIFGLAGTGILVAQPTLGPHERGGAVPHYSTEELEDLLAPVALHPDALIALILPASTHPAEVVLAARRLALDANPDTLDLELWDDSVRALARYPEMVAWMDENLAWTQQVGEAFLAQPAAVMTVIQRLRSRARANGALIDTPEQQVVVVEEHIHIVPAQPDVIYVPRYDPAVVYVSRPYTYPVSFFSFGIGYPAGYWLAYDLDWHYRAVWVVPPPQRVVYWNTRRDVWREPIYRPARPTRDPSWHVWQPRHPTSRPVAPPSRPYRDNTGRWSSSPPPQADRGERAPGTSPRRDREVTRPRTVADTPLPAVSAPSWQPRVRPTESEPREVARREARPPTRSSAGTAPPPQVRPPRRPEGGTERPRVAAPARPEPPAAATPPRAPRERPAEASRPRPSESVRVESRPSPPARPVADLPRPPSVPSDDDSISPSTPGRERHR